MSTMLRPASREDWEALLGAGDQLLLAAMEAGFRADKSSILSLVDLVREVGVPPVLRAFNRTVGLFVMDRSTTLIPLTGKPIRSASLMTAVGAALALDGAPRDNIELTELQLLSRDQHSVHPRASWEAIDEALMQSAIALWRPGSPAFPGPDADHLAQWAKVMAQHVQHGEAVHAMARAGIDLTELGAWMGQVTRPEEEALKNNNNWIGSAPWNGETPLPVFAANLGNFPVAEAWLNTMQPAAAGPMCTFLIEQVAKIENPRVIGGHVLPLPMAIDVCLETALSIEARGEESRVFHQPLLDLMATVARLSTSISEPPATMTLSVKTAQMALLSHSIGLSKDLPSCRWSPNFVQSMLDLPDESGGTLRDAIAREIDLSRPLLGLVRMAAQAHCPPVLDASRLALAVNAETDGPCVLNHVLARAALMDRSGPFVAENFKGTLAALVQAGGQVTSQFPDFHTNSSTTLLHGIAAWSRHSDRLSALVLALDAGCDPNARNYRNRRASACIKDLSQRAEWVGIERSHLARRSALAALSDIDLADPPPNARLKSPCP